MVVATGGCTTGAAHRPALQDLDLLGRSDDAIVALRSIGGAARQPGAGRRHEWIAHLIAGREQPWEVEQELLEAQDACAARLTGDRVTAPRSRIRAGLVRDPALGVSCL